MYKLVGCLIYVVNNTNKNYQTLLKYGCPPHGGFAIGCERLTQKILGLANVKEASLFPRDRKRVTP
jgi:nondiscriminating aspartyl-tRNA synthetase